MLFRSNLWFCEVWPRDGYGLIRNATGEYSDDGAFMFLNRFRVTEILEEVSRIFEYFGLGTTAYLHWKLLYFSALFFRTDFTGACVFQKRSTSTIHLPRLEFGRRTSCLLKFGTRNFCFIAYTVFSRGTRSLFSFKNSLGLFLEALCCPFSLSSSPSPSLLFPCPFSLSLCGGAASPPPPEHPNTTQPIQPVEWALGSTPGPPQYHLSGRNRPSPPELPLSAKNDRSMEDPRNSTKACI